MNSKMTTKKPLTWIKTHQALYDMLYSKYIKENPVIDYDTFIEDNANPKSRKGLMSFIMNRTTYAEGTKKNLIYMCARWLEIIKNSHYKAYAEQGHKLREQVENAESNNTQSVKETEHYRDHSYFYQLIEDMKPTMDQMTYKEHIKYVLLCLLVLQPPVRTSYYISAKFISQNSKNNGTENYVLLNAKNPKTVSLIINNDKVTKSLYYKTRKNLSTIVIQDKFLTDLLFKSYQKYPREYLLQKSPDDDEVITQNTFLRWLRDVTGVEGIDNDIMRSSYITWMYKHVANTFKEKTILAHQMRHSVTSGMKYYNKTLPSETETPLDTEEVEAIEAENSILKDKIEKCETKKINVKKFAKMRYDVLFRLNKNDKLTPRQASIDKYNLEFNEITKQWQ